jgi:hypothetical protein
MTRPIAVLSLVALLCVMTAPAWAQSGGRSKPNRPAGGRTTKFEEAADKTLAPLINIVTRWLFPAVAFAAALYGVARGIKRGEWDFAVICLLASITLAMLPTILGGLFF